MEKGLLDLHNLMRWVVLLLGVWTFFSSMSGMNSGKVFAPRNKKTALFFMISCDIQLLVGLALYFLGPWGMKNIQNQGMGAIMKDTTSRFFAVEHAFGMLVAIILVHIGYSTSKKNIPDAAKFKKLFWFTTIALLIMIITIPWPFREAVARPLFPGMH
jgi:hypothetical protein